MDEQELWCLKFCAEWTGKLLEQVESDSRFEKCADYHYCVNNMDEITKKYRGNLKGFIDFLEKEFCWIITSEQKEKKLIIDENKDFCVCPVTAALKDTVPPTLCNCSEVFASRMFSAVMGRQVKAKVVRSILRDGKSCIYEVDLA